MSGSAITASDSPVLSLTRITKRFGSSIALDGTSFTLRPGTVHALLGENGAGKTTLMRIAFGLLSPDDGDVLAPTRGIRIQSAADAIRAGLGMVHQHFTNVPAMTVAENVALGGHGLFNRRRAAEAVGEIASRTGLSLDPSAVAGELPVGGQQRLEIVKALARDASALILDEPTAVLAPGEASELLRWLRTFADAGSAVVLITHKLREALAIADDVTVLRRGRCVLAAPANTLSVDTLSSALLGPETIAESEREVPHDRGGIVARASHLDVVDARGVAVVHDVSLHVGAGEIVGIAAVEGAGQRELLRVFAGRLAPSAGDLSLPENIGFVPEDRHRDALILEQSATENVVLRGGGARRGIIRWRDERTRTAVLMDTFDVRGMSDRGRTERPVRTLSGGNQQKLVIGRELSGAPTLFVVENPTRGLDIRASAAVHDRLRAAANAGAGVLCYSSDLDEVLALATRVAAMYAGQLRLTTRDRDVVGRAMLGAA